MLNQGEGKPIKTIIKKPWPEKLREDNENFHRSEETAGKIKEVEEQLKQRKQVIEKRKSGLRIRYLTCLTTMNSILSEHSIKEKKRHVKWPKKDLENFIYDEKKFAELIKNPQKL